MLLVLETTKWDQESQPNHTYLLDDAKSRMHGYIKQGTKELIMFSKPFRFDKRYRRFKTIKKNLTFTNK